MTQMEHDDMQNGGLDRGASFVALCRELRALGALSVRSGELSATFAPVAAPLRETQAAKSPFGALSERMAAARAQPETSDDPDAAMAARLRELAQVQS
jgi:hypothetical protein